MACGTHRSSSDTSELGRRLFGYKRREIDKLLEDVADSFEDVWRERGELTDQLEELEKTLDERQAARGRCSRRRSSPPSAPRSTPRSSARREAELIVAEAHAEARVDHPRRRRPSGSGSSPRRGASRRCCARRSAWSRSRRQPPAGRSAAPRRHAGRSEHWPTAVEDTREFQRRSQPEATQPEPEPAGARRSCRRSARPGADEERRVPGPGRDFAWG